MTMPQEIVSRVKLEGVVQCEAGLGSVGLHIWETLSPPNTTLSDISQWIVLPELGCYSMFDKNIT